MLGIFKETASGARNNRLTRHRVLQLAQARRIDAVLVTELSRWGRSTQDLLDTLYQLAGWKVSLAAINGMTFELNTPHGRMMATLLAGIAQFERVPPLVSWTDKIQHTQAACPAAASTRLR